MLEAGPLRAARVLSYRSRIGRAETPPITRPSDATPRDVNRGVRVNREPSLEVRGGKEWLRTRSAARTDLWSETENFKCSQGTIFFGWNRLRDTPRVR